MRYFRVRNHSEFQHYKSGERAKGPPSWIKWYVSCLSSYAFTSLTDAQKWHAVGIALLASQQDNHLPADTRWLARELSASGRVRIEPLLAARFIEWCECKNCKENKGELGPNASNVLAPPASNLLAVEEKRRRDKKRTPPFPPPEGRPDYSEHYSFSPGHENVPLDDAQTLDDFEQFWNAYPKRVKRPSAERAWLRASDNGLPAIKDVLLVIEQWKASAQWRAEGGRMIPDPHNWLDGERWKDGPPPKDEKPGTEDAWRIVK